MTKRSHINLKTKLASALLEIDRLRYILHSKPRLVSYEDSKVMADDSIIAQWHWDHYPHRHADGGPSRAWNLVPIPALEHREKTAKIDVPEMAKSKRIRRKVSLHNVALASKAADGAINDAVANITRRMERAFGKRKIPSRPFPKRNKRKLRPLYP